jgi:hypothetical protein
MLSSSAVGKRRLQQVMPHLAQQEPKRSPPASCAHQREEALHDANRLSYEGRQFEHASTF